MTIIPAGTDVPYQITYLEMQSAPKTRAPDLPEGVRLEVATTPPVWFFLSLYDAVGRDYEWVDKFQEDAEAVRAFVQHPDVQMFVAYRNGWPHGFFQLDWRQPGICDLAYFGLVPQSVGTGIGGPLLKIAVETGWARAGVTKMTVNTCSLDHPRALGLYEKAGFSAVRTKYCARVLTRPRDTSRFSA